MGGSEGQVTTGQCFPFYITFHYARLIVHHMVLLSVLAVNLNIAESPNFGTGSLRWAKTSTRLLSFFSFQVSCLWPCNKFSQSDSMLAGLSSGNQSLYKINNNDICNKKTMPTQFIGYLLDIHYHFYKLTNPGKRHKFGGIHCSCTWPQHSSFPCLCGHWACMGESFIPGDMTFSRIR